MLFFLIVTSIAVLLFMAMMSRDVSVVWGMFVIELWLWTAGIIVFVLHHFVVKYW